MQLLTEVMLPLPHVMSFYMCTCEDHDKPVTLSTVEVMEVDTKLKTQIGPLSHIAVTLSFS